MISETNTNGPKKLKIEKLHYIDSLKVKIFSPSFCKILQLKHLESFSVLTSVSEMLLGSVY